MQVNVAGIRRNIKNLAHNYSDPQVKVREATSNDPWGPSATIMAEIADLTYNVVAFSEIMQMIWKRLNDHGKNWRHVYKALILLEYLIKTGTEKVAQQCKDNIFAIQTLKEFQYFEEGKDQGLHVREKAKTLVSLLKDDERLKNERTKALKAKERFAQHASGFGSDGSIDGPTLGHRDSPSWRTDGEATRSASEIEYVRPQTVGEEELQLQLAMAMSREEAEQEEAKRRSDDVRLQLALSQSEQDFKVPGQETRPQHQSHLMDLLDISLNATSISSPPHNSDPWGISSPSEPPRPHAADPWARTSSPAIDPWQPPSSSGAISKHPIATTGGANSVEGWLSRTQSPSVASGSGSSNEGWLHNNNGGVSGTTSNGNLVGNNSEPINDPWLSKVPQQTVPPDPWLNKTSTGNDAWQPSQNNKSNVAATVADPWRASAVNPGARPSPIGAQTSPGSDYDEFDVISNRSKNLMQNSSNINNNNSSLLDEMDPLAPSKNPPTVKTPQSFLGENSGLVNLDQLIKANANVGQPAPYNPFGDLTQQPPKTNLFQQQMQPVPSINQLKQQPFPITINQDPWAPTNSNQSNQYDEQNERDINDSFDVFETNNNNENFDFNYTNNNYQHTNYKIYFDEEYQEHTESSFKTMHNEFINNNSNNNTNNNNSTAPWLKPEAAASNPFLS